MAGYFKEALITGKALEVEMDKAEFVEFKKDGICSVGTQNLNSCSVAILVSPLGAILAHIAPRPATHLADPLDPFAGDRHVEEIMNKITSLYARYQNFFAPERSAVVVSAIHMGEIALPDQMAIISRSFEKLGIIPASAFYSVPKSSDSHGPGQGTVFVDGGREKPIVYVEDQEIQL
jgi:hypothetical protein